MTHGFTKWLCITGCVLGCPLAVGACGETVITTAFNGESRNVAQTISDFQKNATAGDQAKLCERDLATVVTTRLKTSGGCQAVLKDQLRQVDTLNLSVESIVINGLTARARVKSTWSGKLRFSTLSLVREGTRWKISGASQ